MMPDKALRYLGFARKAGKLVSGTGTCTFTIRKGRAALAILAEDISENSEKKIMKEIRRGGVRFVKYGKKDDLSRAAGQSDRSIFVITDDQFAVTILNEIMREKIEGGCANENQRVGD